MSVVFIAIGIIAIVMLGMAVGVLFQQKSLRGSCGGSEVFDCDGESLSCGACPNRDKHHPRKAGLAEFPREFIGTSERPPSSS